MHVVLYRILRGMSAKHVIKQAASYLLMIADPSGSHLVRGDLRNVSLPVAVAMCILGLAIVSLAVLIPIAYFTN